MTENILIAIAWPYANAEIHVGNITGSHLPGDIIARYHRLKGRNVAMVSGTDSHGTPVTLRAESEGLTNEEVYKRFHDGFLELFQGMGITYDMFTTTHTENHFKVSQSIFLALKENGHIFAKKSMQWYSPDAKRFLPDRYVEGTCYICETEGARSDQCDACGNVLEPAKLINPKAKTGDGSLELRETEHFYLDLSQLEPTVANFLRERSEHMRDTVLGESLGKIEAEGLLIGGYRGGHTLAGIAVAMNHPHTEFGEGAQQRHFFAHNLAGTEKGDRFGTVLFLDGLEGRTEFL